jgi:hypothetical protein
MKLMRGMIVASSLAWSLASAQTQSHSVSGPASQTQTDQITQNERREVRDDLKSNRKADTCVGPVSFCRPYFGS